MRMVTLVFQDQMIFRKSCGSILSSSFTMPSGPGDSSLLRNLQSEKFAKKFARIFAKKLQFEKFDAFSKSTLIYIYI